ncbi:hypothetical protein TorRG33x02_021430, partial [Trema orientale]
RGVTPSGLAARAGDVSQLYSALGKDVNALDNICTDNLCDTPLHTVASLNKGEFCLELMRLKPSFAEKTDTSRFLPIQLAMKNNHAVLVSHLLEADGRLGRKKGRDGNILIFFACEIGAYDIIQKLLTIDDELKKALDPFSTGENIKKVLANLKNLEGGTVAHLIVKNKVQEMMKVLIELVWSDIDWTSVNLAGHTPSALALDIIKFTEMHMTIAECICSNELAIRIRDQPVVARHRRSVLDRICAWSRKNTPDDNRPFLQHGAAVMAAFFLIGKYFLDKKVRIATGVDDISVIGMVNTAGFFLSLIRTASSLLEGTLIP